MCVKIILKMTYVLYVCNTAMYISQSILTALERVIEVAKVTDAAGLGPHKTVKSHLSHSSRVLCEERGRELNGLAVRLSLHALDRCFGTFSCFKEE